MRARVDCRIPLRVQQHRRNDLPVRESRRVAGDARDRAAGVLEAHHRRAVGMRLEAVDDGVDQRRRQRWDEARFRVQAERAGLRNVARPLQCDVVERLHVVEDRRAGAA